MSSLGAALSAAFVRLRWLIAIGCMVGVVVAGGKLPALHGAPSGTLKSLLPAGSAAVRGEKASVQRFTVPLLSRTVVVVRNPHGLPLARQAKLVALAEQLSAHRLRGYREIEEALPVPNVIGTGPLSRRPGTTMVLYLYFAPSLQSSARLSTARRLIDHEIGRRPGEYEGVTGVEPADAAAGGLIQDNLAAVEIAVIVLITVIVGCYFRAVTAAVLVAGAVICAYVVAEHVVGELVALGGVTVPSQAGPVLVVLVVGVTTDYSIFLVSGVRERLRRGLTPREAAADVMRRVSPIVITAGVTVAAATAALLVAGLGFVRDLGPALAIAVLVAMAVAVTLIPAVLAIAGESIFWPGGVGVADDPQTAHPPRVRRWSQVRDSVARRATRHPVLAVLAAAIVVLGAGSGLSQFAIANDAIVGLPASSPVHRAFDQVRRGFVGGVVSPVIVVVTGHGVGARPGELDRLQGTLEHQPGVAAVFGPRQSIPGFSAERSFWRTADAARYVLFERGNPLGAAATDRVRALQAAMPRLLSTAGLRSTRGLVAGDSALSAAIVDAIVAALERVVPVMVGAIFVVLAIYLRALIAPIYLVMTSVLAAGAALGLTTYVMGDLAGYGAITYYVVIVVVVLLIALGSDYNIFLIGKVWQEGRRRGLADAVAAGGTQAARPIRIAAFVLALSFALLAIVPLRAFREIAFGMTSGLLIDGFVIRAVLVPALLMLVGPRSAWPGHALHRRTERSSQAAERS